MLVEELDRRFELEAPVTVMVRATLENVLSVDGLNSLFEKYAERQSNKTLMFSTVADIMGMVACRIHPSAQAGGQAREEAGPRDHALYGKLQRMEPHLSRHLVKETAQRMDQIVRKAKGRVPKLLEG